MRRLILTALLSLATLGPAAAAPGAASRAQPDRMSRMQADLSAACRADCLQQAARPGAHPSAAQACHVRCGAGQAYSQQQQRNPAPAAGLLVVHQVAPATHGVIFAARSPSAAFGLVVGERDRLAAFRNAEARCTQAGPGCRIVAEFTTSCGAVAQAVRRHRSAFLMTSDASTFEVLSAHAGTGETREAAERDALAECRSRDGHATCRIAAVQCRSQG
ncbi:DUF4189 domain-containing protein [Roseococcus sp. SDR]|uniref:DUF4189 domain-containing protein n=1 Tax=Roseococcus sp. SDR TaxID=2835532 RepID=UPI001BCCBAA7|nr:DUF4189 domain-containing protein [Roseococcus sp. SDR]MBS7791893.1 DUF4189 domain-containing protein [Roseococcus sp. SDR]MBV1847207.1 DUF4189 domain-containing protein [Roseococcus sp. SDR]